MKRKETKRPIKPRNSARPPKPVNLKNHSKAGRLLTARLRRLTRAGDTFDGVRHDIIYTLFDCADLAYEIYCFFYNILEFSNRLDYSGLDSDVAEGVVAAIRIKVESLAEALQEFDEERAAFVGGLKRVAPDISELKAAAVCAAGHAPRHGRRAGANMGSYAREFRMKRANVYKRYLSDADKLRVNFLKNTLLFEISTFDEMLSYSVSRLQASASADVRALADYIGIKAYDIRQALSKFGIQAVEPQPHDQFSGREHEALIAESSPEYKRGEVVSLVNRGYRFGDAVLVRANVIAAR